VDEITADIPPADGPPVPGKGAFPPVRRGALLAAISEQCFRSLAETAHDAIFFTDSSGSVVFWNGAAEEMFGYSAEEMGGKPLTIIVPPRLREAHERGIARALSGNLPVSGKSTEITGLRKNGREFPLELTLATWRSRDGAFLTAIARDITGRRRAEAELRESEERYRTLFEESPIALWEEDFTGIKNHFARLRGRGVGDFRSYFDNHPETVSRCLGMTRIVDVNHTALRMYGADGRRDRFGGLATIFCDESRETFRDALVSLAEGRNVFEGECVTRSLRGDRNHVFLRWVAAPESGGAPWRLLLSVIDLTAHKKLEAQLLQSQKMEAVGRLAGGVAHDFNNLLTAITTSTDLLFMDLPQDSPGREAAAVISQTAEEAGKLVHQLLALSRQQTLELSPLDLNASVSKLSRLFPHILGEKVRHSLELSGDLDAALAHPGQIEQVILNLVVNADEAMPEGGTLSIATANTIVDGRKARLLTDISPGRYVTLRIIDSGAGIAPGEMEHIFEPFYSTKAEGNGLGLSTVYGIVRQLGGHISATSTPGRGASFTVHLPAVSQEPPEEKAAG